MTILIVDNSAAEISLISDMLCEYNLITANDGFEAMQVIGMNPDIDMVIMDLKTPDTNFCQIFHNFMSQDAFKDLRIIILSDSDAQEDEIHCLSLGVNDYIRKSQIQSLKYRVKIQSEVLRRQKELKRNAKNLETIMESIFQQAPIGITLSHNSDSADSGGGNWLLINPEFERICGRNKEELLKLGWARITHPDDLKEDLEQFHRLQAGEIKSYSMLKRYIRPNGSVIWVYIIVSALNIENENQYNHICLVQDMTDQKRIMDQVELDQKAFRTFIDSSQDFIFLKDEHFNHVFANEALADFYKVKRKDIIGRSDYEFMNTESAEQCRMSDQKAIGEKKPSSLLKK